MAPAEGNGPGAGPSDQSEAGAMENSPGTWLLMVDGAARGNPGKAGCGAVILDEKGGVIKELCRYLGYATNNVAEYEALLMGLHEVSRLGGKKVKVQSDSELLVRQLNGRYRVKDEKLKKLHMKAVALLREFDTYSIFHIPRGQNRLADRLANQAIDDQLQKTEVSN